MFVSAGAMPCAELAHLEFSAHGSHERFELVEFRVEVDPPRLLGGEKLCRLGLAGTQAVFDGRLLRELALHRFDEVTILFRLDGYRARDAAKIGIDHFTLVPRGL